LNERREFQRLYLTHPLDGWFGDFDIRLLDVSATGALIEHDGTLPDDSRALLRFYWRDVSIELIADTVRNEDGTSGLHFIDDCPELRRAIAISAEEILRAQEANARGERLSNVIDGDETLTAASAGLRGSVQTFVTLTLTDSGWLRRHSLLPEQPPDGFTVSSREPQEQIDLLCATYESGDAEARRITRLLAELSVADVIRGG
jgi:hypothetical protein